MAVDAYQAAALTFCNEIRAAYAYAAMAALLPGKQCESWLCPMAETIRAGTSFIGVTATRRCVWVARGRPGTDEDRAIFPCPPLVRAFVERYDAGQYPELVTPVGW